ncbi:MAG: AraC family transcriptional regulator [Bacteroidales bacterium]|nr:AraC family transcriptional regulator [Bacteroidales bacterium]
MRQIIIIATTIAGLLLILLIFKKRKKVPDYILGLWLYLLAAHLSTQTGFVSIFSGDNHQYYINISFLLLQGPFLYTYILSLTSTQSAFRLCWLWHFLPFIVFNLIVLSSRTTPGWLTVFDSGPADGAGISYVFYVFLFTVILSMGVYLILSFRKLLGYRRKISLISSSGRVYEHDWLNYLIIAQGCTWILLSLGIGVFILLKPLPIGMLNMIIFTSVAVFVIVAGFFGLRHTRVFADTYRHDLSDFSSDDRDNKGKTLLPEETDTYRNSLLEIMERDKPFTDPELTIRKLSEISGIPVHTLSSVLNNHLNTNFFQFINRYRVEDVKKRIIDPRNKQYTLLGLALESGFSSKSSFNRIFKEMTGKTPSEFKAEVSVFFPDHP